MSTPVQDDPLYQVFEEHLHSGMYDEQPVETFVRDVVDFYWSTLVKTGHIPQRMHEMLKVDLFQDVQDMLRAKIYGHYGIGEYNRTVYGGPRAMGHDLEFLPGEHWTIILEQPLTLVLPRNPDE